MLSKYEDTTIIETVLWSDPLVNIAICPGFLGVFLCTQFLERVFRHRNCARIDFESISVEATAQITWNLLVIPVFDGRNQSDEQNCIGADRIYYAVIDTK